MSVATSAMRHIPIAAPETPDIDASLARLRTVLMSGSFTNADEVEQLETEAASVLGTPHCVAVSSCTSGLMLVERCLGLRGEVVTPSFTFFATGHGLLWNGLTPRFADIDADSLQMDPTSVERSVGSNTGAILGVHLFGCPAPVEELTAIARNRNVPLIFDGAHALGAAVGGRGVAGWGDATIYSLSPTKQLTAGEGGLIATPHADLAAKLRLARNYGKGADYDCEFLGLNARMTEFQAAFCREGLTVLPQTIASRNRIASVYVEGLAAAPGIRLQQPPSGTYSGRKDFAILVNGEMGVERSSIEKELAAEGVETRRYFDPPLHEQTLYREFYRPEEEPLKETIRASRDVICLPIHGGVTERDAERIASIVCQTASAVTTTA